MKENTLPKGWTQTTIKNVLDFVLGGDWGKDPLKFEDKDYTEVLCIRGSEIKHWQENKGSTAVRRLIKDASLQKRKLQLGDILIEISGGGPDQPVGRTVYIDEQALAYEPDVVKVCTNFLRLLRFNESLNSKFINKFFDYFYLSGRITEYQGGSNNLRNLKFKEFETIKLPIPPRPEQDRIVAKVDALMAQVTVMQESLQHIPQLLKDFRQQVLTQAVTGKLTEEWREGKELESDLNNPERIFNKRWKDYKNGLIKSKKPNYLSYKPTVVLKHKIPSWRVSPIGFLSDCIVPGRDKPKSFTGKIPWITTPDLVSDSIEISTKNIGLTETEINEVKGKVIPPNSVIISIVGRFGISVVNSRKVVINQQLHAFLPSEFLIPKYLMYFFRTQENFMNSLSSSTTVAYINKTKANSIPIPVPTILEQEEIVNRVESLFSKADAIQQQYDALKQKIDTLPQAILHKAFKGELVEQLESDGSAEELLREIEGLKIK